MKILLAYTSGMPDRTDPYITLLPTGVCSLHAVLREEGFDSLLANFSGFSEKEIIRQITVHNPTVVGISQWTHNRHASHELSRLIRHAVPTCTIIMGGAHATFSYADILYPGSPVDCVVIGEGEGTVSELVRKLRDGTGWQDIQGIAYLEQESVIVTGKRPHLRDLDSLPMATRYLGDSVGVDIQLQAEFIITTRGCPSACYFCSSPQFWDRKVRFRSPGNIVDEMEYIRNRFGLIYFSIRDDTFTVDRNRTIEFCRMLIERKLYIVWNCQSRVATLDEELLIWMKRAGCECVQLGVESGSPRVLKQLGKVITPAQVVRVADLIRKVGISLSIYLITDVPGETEEDIQQSIELIKQIGPDDGYVSPLAYFPGTRLFNEAVDDGTIEKNAFVKQEDPAVYAMSKNNGKARRLLKSISKHRRQSGEKCFREQKNLLGFCAVTNVLSGECFRQHGDYAAAEQEFRELVNVEPQNPWGWYLLAELYTEIGRMRKAEECYRTVCEIVPEHVPSREVLRVIKKRG
jgi:radical SAM superfamily enzyme YgiQ (UPF0313 family)